MDNILVPLLSVTIIALNLYTGVLFVAIIAHWLIAFRIINMSNQFVSWVVYALDRLTDPVLRVVRRVVPDIGGIDISPIIVFLILQFVIMVLQEFRLDIATM